MTKSFRRIFGKSREWSLTLGGVRRICYCSRTAVAFTFTSVITPVRVAGRQEYTHGQMPACRMRRLLAIPDFGDIDSCLQVAYLC
jgi:hypothetical protein